jgi:hypothetical protein
MDERVRLDSIAVSVFVQHQKLRRGLDGKFFDTATDGQGDSRSRMYTVTQVNTVRDVFLIRKSKFIGYLHHTCSGVERRA